MPRYLHATIAANPFGEGIQGSGSLVRDEMPILDPNPTVVE